MWFERLARIMRTASFGLAVIYALLFAVSALILGIIVYWTVQTSLDRQMLTRLDAEIDLLQQEFRSEDFKNCSRRCVSERTTFLRLSISSLTLMVIVWLATCPQSRPALVGAMFQSHPMLAQGAAENSASGLSFWATEFVSWWVTIWHQCRISR